MVKDVRLRLLLSLIFILLSTFSYADNPPETLYDEGVKQGVAFKINCVGAGIACTTSGSTGTLTVAGGGGSGTNYWSLSPGNIGINTTNNVGIGTVTPVALLHINSSAAQDLFRVDDTAGSDSTPFIIDQTGNVGIGTAVPQAIVAISSTLNQALFRVDDNGNGDLSPFIIDANGNVGIGTTNTERDALLVMSGNVGIGTWVPSTKLDVAGTIVTSGGGAIGIGTSLMTSGLSVMNGNVGIGTWVPSSFLNVVGNVGIGTSNNSAYVSSGVNPTQLTLSTFNSGGGINNYAGITMQETVNNGSNNGIVQLLAVNPGAAVSTADFVVNTRQASTFAEGMRVAGTNVGLGTVSPGQRLDVVGNIRTTGTIFTGGNVGVGTSLADGILSVGLQKLTVLSAGNVGIGSITPGNALDVNGAIRSTSSGNSYFTGNLGINTVTPNDSLIVMTGNMGIGTGLPGVALDIVGTMRMNGTGAGSFRVQTGSNTACTTTCTTGKALFGLDDGTLGVALPHLVGPTDATAEECLCGS